MELEKAENMANDLITKHGLSSKYRFEFDNSVRRFGQCRYRDCVISLSRNLVSLNTADRVKQTILHETAHALAGPEHGHDNVWREIALAIGDDGERCYSLKDTVQPQARHIYACASCGFKYERIKIYKRYKHAYHSTCGREKGRLIKIK